MEIVRLKITATVITARYGALSPGDMLNTDLAFAKHLVDDCKAAKFVDAKVSGSIGQSTKSTRVKRNDKT